MRRRIVRPGAIGVNEPLTAAISRRRLLQAGAVGAVGAWLPTIKIPVASAGAGVCPTPPDFPAGISLYRQGFENWAKALVIDDLWTCAPRSAEDVVELANWAHRHGWRLRPRGSMHGWSPICITPGTSCDDPVVLADTTAHLTEIELVSEDGPAVRVGAGVTMEELVTGSRRRALGSSRSPRSATSRSAVDSRSACTARRCRHAVSGGGSDRRTDPSPIW